jgi:hypothetical protein
MMTAVPLRNSIATTAIATLTIMVFAAAIWVSMTGPQTVSAGEVLLSSVLMASLIFPLAYLWANSRAGAKKAVSARFMMSTSILWMLVSVVGISANLWLGLADAGSWTTLRSVQFWAILAMFAGMLVSSLVQLAAAADFHIKESAAHYSGRPRYGCRPRTA